MGFSLTLQSTLIVSAKSRPQLVTYLLGSLPCFLSCFPHLLIVSPESSPSINHCKRISVSGFTYREPDLRHLFNKYLLNTYFLSGFELNSWDSEANILWFFLSGIGFGGGTVCRQLMKYEKDCERRSIRKMTQGQRKEHS